jgi:3',5'-cyclic AMP phosphodiesterase CpdA
VSSVADDEVVVHHGTSVRVYGELAPGREHDLDGQLVRTLEHPGGELLCRFATVNDVHFGETACGVIEGTDIGPVLRAGPGEDPYPEVMNAAAVAEIAAIDPAVVLAKGDLTADGTAEEYGRFLDVYGGAFGERLHHVRGNHDAMSGLDHGTEGIPRAIDLPGVRLAVLDTVVPGHDGGRLDGEQVAWLDAVAADAGRDGLPVLAFGHHHCWDPHAGSRPAHYFGIAPDDSEALIEVFRRRPALRGWFAGHTHRNRVRRFDVTGDVPFVEVACVKDFPGSWAEYRVFEGGILQVHRRISAPEALAWSERCRALYDGAYPAYAMGELDERCFTLPGGS